MQDEFKEERWVSYPFDKSCQGGGKTTLIFRVKCEATACGDDETLKQGIILEEAKKKVEMPILITEVNNVKGDNGRIAKLNQTLYFYDDKTVTADLDLCDILDCSRYGQQAYRSWSVVICATDNRDKRCVDQSMEITSKLSPHRERKRLERLGDHNALKEPALLLRLKVKRRLGENTCEERGSKNCNPISITLISPSYDDSGLYIAKTSLGWGYFLIKVVQESEKIPANTRDTPVCRAKTINETKPIMEETVRQLITDLEFGKLVGHLQKTWCESVIDVSTWNNATRLTKARADVWWYCGGKRILGTLPLDWIGTCTIVSLIFPITYFPTSAKKSPFAFDPNKGFEGSPTYMDSIGVPRGVPTEYKLADQVAAGFESFLCWWCTINKNVDRINYIHYNVQKLTNLTRDAVEGLAEELRANTLMTYQNRLAIDFLLSAQGGVCSMFGEECCTFIPNNTAPDGSVTKALAGLRTMAAELKSHSGIQSPVQEWLDKMLGKWKGLIVSVVMSLATVAGLLALCGCCCIPCIRSLCVRCISSTIEKKDYPAALQMPESTYPYYVYEPVESTDTVEVVGTAPEYARIQEPWFCGTMGPPTPPPEGIYVNQRQEDKYENII
uniref:Uncharacterized protein n=1 Tax=Sphaeramia orbicularis TaxID=375764 RepID=A0A673AIJ0_9TELE